MATDLRGEQFGKLTVIRLAPNSNTAHLMYVCKCECGNTYKARGALLRDGTTTQCRECAHKEAIKTRETGKTKCKSVKRLIVKMKRMLREMQELVCGHKTV